MAITGTILRGKYFDSVKLMLISKEIRQKEGVIDAVAIMATQENKSILSLSQRMNLRYVLQSMLKVIKFPRESLPKHRNGLKRAVLFQPIVKRETYYQRASEVHSLNCRKPTWH
jgi:hypothetical protein